MANTESRTKTGVILVLGIVVILVIFAGLSFLYFWRLAQDPQKSQIASQTAAVLFAFLGFLMTAVWVWITAQYVLTNDRTLKLMRLQWDYQNRVDVRWGLRTKEDRAWLWVSNLGIPPIMISEVITKQALDESKCLARHKHFIVQHAETRGFYLSERDWEDRKIFCDHYCPN
jgi:hypothetical protein